jgi:hypothetical protein
MSRRSDFFCRRKRFGEWLQKPGSLPFVAQADELWMYEVSYGLLEAFLTRVSIGGAIHLKIARLSEVISWATQP